jgi:hypothetical protein
MPTTPPTDAEEASELLSLAAWYRSWAEVADGDDEKGRRLDMAIDLEKRARAMSPADGGAARADALDARSVENCDRQPGLRNSPGFRASAALWIALDRPRVDRAMAPHDRIREHAKQAREAAQQASDPMTKARLHQIANDLEKVAEELEGRSDPERRS